MSENDNANADTADNIETTPKEALFNAIITAVTQNNRTVKINVPKGLIVAG